MAEQRDGKGTEAVTIDVIDGWQTVRMHSRVGKRSPAHCRSIGKALPATTADAVRATARQISVRLGAPETALCADAP